MAFNSIKLANLILFMANHPQVKNLGVTKLWKLIYFVDAMALRDTGETITGSEFIKYEHGPVPSKGERILKRLRKNDQIKIENKSLHGYLLTNVVALAESDSDIFSDTELEIISDVCDRYGMQTAQKLSELSHQEPSWKLAKDLQKLDVRLMSYGSREDSAGL